MTGRALVTGATGFIGGRLSSALAEKGWDVRCLVRDRSRAAALEQRGFDLHEGDMLRPETLSGAGRGIDVAYYLVHSMGRGAGADFAARDRAAAGAFAALARHEGVEQVVYLGGLGDEAQSEHLHSRHTTALVFRENGPPLTYFHATMVVGARSESYRTLKYLVKRLPLMIAPAWLAKDTQPIAIDDVLKYLVQAPSTEEARAQSSRSVGLTSSPTRRCSIGPPTSSASVGAHAFRSRSSRRGCHRSGSGRDAGRCGGGARS